MQALVNIGAVLGLLPITGVPLPLVSYGGSALLATLFALGMLLSLRPARAGRARGARRSPAAAAQAARGVRAGAHANGRAAARERRPAGAVHVVLAGGGSAGHVEPLLAVADALRRRDPRRRRSPRSAPRAGLETRLVPGRAATTSR